MEFLGGLTDIYLDMSVYMLAGMILAGLLHEFMKKETVAKHLGKGIRFTSLKAALFGVPLSVCSCGVLPFAVFLGKSGASTAAVMSFIISAPQTGIDSFVATLGMMGVVFAVYRPLAAFISGAAGGAIIQAIGSGKERRIGQEQVCCNCEEGCCGEEQTKEKRGIRERVKSIAAYSFVDFLDDISLHFIIGLIIAAAITALFPAQFFSDLNIGSGIAGMLIMLAVGLPMYICSTSSIPVALSLMAKGFSPGAAFVFLFAGPATNAASVSVLIKRFGKKTVAVYLAVMAVFAVLFGMLLDGLIAWFNIPVNVNSISSGLEGTKILEIAAGAVFGALLLRSLISKLRKRLKRKSTE